MSQDKRLELDRGAVGMKDWSNIHAVRMKCNRKMEITHSRGRAADEKVRTTHIYSDSTQIQRVRQVEESGKEKAQDTKGHKIRV